MGFGNVSERRSAPPQVGVSVVILALGPRYRQQCRRFRQRRELGPFPSLVAPGQARPSAVPGLLGVARR